MTERRPVVTPQFREERLRVAGEQAFQQAGQRKNWVANSAAVLRDITRQGEEVGVSLNGILVGPVLPPGRK